MATRNRRAPVLCDDERVLSSADPDAVSPRPFTAAAAAPRKRDFRASDGILWCVHERDTAHMAHARGPRCLVFENENTLRVVWRYPANWATLSDAALETLSNDR